MAKKTGSNKSSTITIRKGVKIGELDAEMDKTFLEHSFVEKPELTELKNLDGNQCILVGRTGSGKTALLNAVIDDENVIVNRIEPEEMSLKYLVNSDILQYYEKLDIKVDYFYKVLWKHVFIVELLKLHGSANSEKMSNTLEKIRDSILSRFGQGLGQGKAEQRAAKYLEEWENSFWLNTDEKVKELEQSLQTKFVESGNIKTPADIIALGVQYDETKDEKVRTEMRTKAQNIMNDLQVKEINEIVQVMRDDLFKKKKGRFYLIIDNLDKEWVDRSIVYNLIRSMIDAIKELNQIPGVKIIIALRQNLLNLVFTKHATRGFQREKYSGLFVNLNWDDEELKALVEKRLQYIFRQQYMSRNVKFEDAFKLDSKSQDPFEYMLERTLMRPRDMIDFVNCCIERANGKEITFEIIKSAELKYSQNRRQAIIDEWLENFPLIEEAIQCFTNIKQITTFTELKSLWADQMAELFFTKTADDQTCGALAGDIKEYQASGNADKLMISLALLAYEVGIIAIKPNPQMPYGSYHLGNNDLTKQDLGDDSKFKIHKMFWKALKTQLSRENS